jgi:hypothetical protein
MFQFDEDNKEPTRLCFTCIQDIKRWMLFRERYHKATRQFAANNEIQIQIKIPESTPPVTADLSPASSNGKNSKKVTSPPNKTSSFLDNWLVKVQKPSKNTKTILKELRIMLSRMPLTPELEEYLASQRKIKSELEEEVPYIKIEPKNEPIDDTEELLETRNHLIGALKEFTSTKQLRSAPIKNLQSGLPPLKSSPTKKILIKPKQTLKLKSGLIENRKKSIESTMETSEEITLPSRYKPGPKSKRISEQTEQISKQITETSSNERVSTQDETVTSNEVRTSIIRKPCPKSKQNPVETQVGTQILRKSGPEFSSGTEENTSIIQKPCPKSKQIPIRTETGISVLHKPCPKSKKICVKTEKNTSVLRKPCPKSKQTPVQTEECSPIIQEPCPKSKQIPVETQIDTPVILKPCPKSKQISSDSNITSPIARMPCPKSNHVPEQNETSVTVADLERMLSKPMPGSKRQVIEAQLKALKNASSSPTSSIMTTSSDSDDFMVRNILVFQPLAFSSTTCFPHYCSYSKAW